MRPKKLSCDKPIHINLRLTLKQDEFITELSNLYGVNKSEVIRILIDSFRKGKRYEN